jgi:hypothetical protein
MNCRLSRRVAEAFGLGLLLALGFGIPPPATAQQTTGALDGKTFVGQIGEKGKDKGDADEFRFSAGRFHSNACDAYGFSSAPYQSRSGKTAMTFHFQSETRSAKEGRMVWKGIVRGSTVEGTAVWLKPGQAPAEYWFRGKLKK